MEWTLEGMRRCGITLEQATRMYNDGRIDDKLYGEYCHEWQTSAPRFSVQACRCTECMKNPVDPF